MRAAFVLLLVGLAAVLAVCLWSGGDELTPDGRPGEPDSGSSPAQVPEAALTGARAVTTRTEVETPPPEDLADQPTACLLVVDYKGGRPIEGATIRRMKGGAAIGFSDAHGLAHLPLKEREQLAIIADGFLLRMAPTRLGSTGQEPQRIQLVPDRWSQRYRFEFRSSIDGGVIEEVFAQFRQAAGARQQRQSFADADAVVQRARQEDNRLQGVVAGADVATDGTRRLQDGAIIRLAPKQSYSVEVASTSGLAARLTVDAVGDARGTAVKTIRVTLVPGEFVIGAIFSDKGKPLAGATLTQQGSDPLGLLCTTGSDGLFSFGPCPSGDITLLVRHPDHEPTAFGPVKTTDSDVRVTLRELPRSTLRGRVRRRPGLEPIARAAVSWSSTASAPITTTTAADGTFQLATTGEIAGRLLVSAVGCIALEELVSPGATFENYDLLPSSTSERLEEKLTAVFSGIVLDAKGRPVANVAVRWKPNERSLGGGVPGRRTISGNVLLLPLTLTTVADGSFVIETHHLGPGTLCLSDHIESGIPTEAIAGATVDGLQLRQR